MLGATVYRPLLFISVDAHMISVTVIILVFVLGVDGPSESTATLAALYVAVFRHGKVLS